MDHVLHHGLLVHGARRPGQAEPPGGVGLHGYNGELPLRRAPAAPKAPMPARRAARLRLPTPRKAPETLAMARKAPAMAQKAATTALPEATQARNAATQALLRHTPNQQTATRGAFFASDGPARAGADQERE